MGYCAHFPSLFSLCFRCSVSRLRFSFSCLLVCPFIVVVFFVPMFIAGRRCVGLFGFPLLFLSRVVVASLFSWCGCVVRCDFGLIFSGQAVCNVIVFFI